MGWEAIATIGDAAGEWWIGPLATYLDRPTPRTVCGAIGHDGTILACEFDHETGQAGRYRIAQAGADDHNTPALWIAPGRRSLIAWSNHNADHYLRLKVGAPTGTLGSLTVAPEIAIDTGGPASYAQIHRIRHLSNEEQDTFWAFFRRHNVEWLILTLTVEQEGGTVSWSPARPLLRTAGRQAYVSTADAHCDDGSQVIRMAWGYNPAQPVHAIRYFEIDCVTGEIVAPTDPEFAVTLDQLGGERWIDDAAVGPLLPEPPPGWSRRLFYVRPGPDAPAVSYAEWDTQSPDTAIYRVVELGPDAGLYTHDLGVAGRRVGYTPEANYIAGLAFEDPSRHRAVVCASGDGGVECIERVLLGDVGVARTLLRSQPTAEGRLIRPVSPVNGGPLAAVVTNMRRYGDDYRDFRGDLLGIIAPRLPPISGQDAEVPERSSMG